ncbi:MAG: hypothetical protein JSW27_06120 [Phycisphaerales bacterium]|nr:MAG: hypothetical protein JSW27_06120 [Phycisphaerales bacterium]
MGDNGTQAKVTGPTPILFVSVGPCAEAALRALSETVQEMASPVQGPFGLLSLDVASGEMLASHWTWLSDFEIPASSELCGLSREVADSDEQLLTAVSSLVRQLRSTEPVADPASPGRVRMTSYIVIDLSVDDAVSCGWRLMQLLRRADRGHDMVVLGLTARTATSGAGPGDRWFERWTQLLTLLQDEPLAEKVYVLDGPNASGTWLDRPEQLHRLAAGFLLHHGVTCRRALRQTERRRVSPKENILNICGSFGVREITTDLSEVTERIARRLAYENLADLYGQPLARDRRQHIEEGAQALVEEIQQIYGRADGRERSSADKTVTAAGECALRNEDVAQAIEKTLDRVCARDPLVSLCHLLKCLHPRLRRLLTRNRLVQRQRTREAVVSALQHRDKLTYEPMRVWLARFNAKWTDRFTPEEGPASRVTVSRPPSKASYRVGLILFAMGLFSIASGLFFQERVFALGGGLLALAATVLMIQPAGWNHCTRTRLPEGREADEFVPAVSYRRRASLPVRSAALVLAVMGVVSLTWSLWPGPWPSTMVFLAGLSAFIALVGLTVLLSSSVAIRPDQVREREAPGHCGPPIWGWRGVGLLCLAGGWVVLCLFAAVPTRVDTALQWGCHLGGLFGLLAAAVLGLHPRVGSVRLAEHVPSVPKPFTGGISGPAGDPDSLREIAAMTQWIGGLNLEPEQCLLRGKAAEKPRNRDVLFDLLATDWDLQLAEAFRKTLKIRSNESLRDLAFETKAWASCVVGHLQNPAAPSADLAVLFASQVVRAWIDSVTLKELVSHLEADFSRFGQLIARVTSANWPATRVEPDMGTSVVAMDKAVWDALAPLIEADGNTAVIPLDAKTSGDGISILRFVQGLRQGWRGFPALPGQDDTPDRAEPAHAGDVEHHQGPA